MYCTIDKIGVFQLEGVFEAFVYEVSRVVWYVVFRLWLGNVLLKNVRE